MLFKRTFILLCLCMIKLAAFSQKRAIGEDTVIKPKPAISVNTRLPKDTTLPYSPRKAIVRSAIIPGWGQITNKKYWKVPLVYGALGTTGYLFFRNLHQYKDAKRAFILASDTNTANDILIPEPYYSVRFQ